MKAIALLLFVTTTACCRVGAQIPNAITSDLSVLRPQIGGRLQKGFPAMIVRQTEQLCAS
jgi:hypothetical protein